MGGRFRGIYYIEKILYETDKHVDDNFNLMACALAMRGINIADIKKVYVLGHSFGDADFKNLPEATGLNRKQKVLYDCIKKDNWLLYSIPIKAKRAAKKILKR